MTCDRRTDSVCNCAHDQTAQGIDDSSLPTVIASVRNTSDSFGIQCYRSTGACNSLRIAESPLEIGTETQQPDCADECASVTLIAYCLAQYMSTLDVEHWNRVQSPLLSQTVSWISKLFR